jgi:hypothetical protein
MTVHVFCFSLLDIVACYTLYFLFLKLPSFPPIDLKLLDVIRPKVNSMAAVPKRTIPTERPPLVGEVSANICV